MNGVEILNQIEIMKSVGNSKLSFIIGLIICIGAVLLFLHSDYFDITVAICVGLFLGIVSGFFAYTFTLHDIRTGTYQYQVIISDDVNFNEFIHEYNIVKQEGKIYTIEEK